MLNFEKMKLELLEMQIKLENLQMMNDSIVYEAYLHKLDVNIYNALNALEHERKRVEMLRKIPMQGVSHQ